MQGTPWWALCHVSVFVAGIINWHANELNLDILLQLILVMITAYISHRCIHSSDTTAVLKLVH